MLSLHSPPFPSTTLPQPLLANPSGRRRARLAKPISEKFTELARVALRRQISFEEQAKTIRGQVTQQQELTDKLKDGLNKMRIRYQQLTNKRDELVSRAKLANAQVRVQMRCAASA